MQMLVYTSQRNLLLLLILLLSQSGVFLSTEELEFVNEFNNLGVILRLQTLKNLVKIITKKKKINLFNFKQIKGSLSDAAALMFLHSMIL